MVSDVICNLRFFKRFQVLIVFFAHHQHVVVLKQVFFVYTTIIVLDSFLVYLKLTDCVWTESLNPFLFWLNLKQSRLSFVPFSISCLEFASTRNNADVVPL